MFWYPECGREKKKKKKKIGFSSLPPFFFQLTCHNMIFKSGVIMEWWNFSFSYVSVCVCVYVWPMNDDNSQFFKYTSACYLGGKSC